MARIGSVIFDGVENAYLFEVYPLDQEFGGTGAVYVYARCMVGRNGRPRYSVAFVGETASLKEAALSDEKRSVMEANGVNRFCVHRDADRESRLAKEADLLAAHGPAANGGQR